MTREEAAKMMVRLYAEAVRMGLYETEGSEYSEAVSLAVGALMKDGDNDG